MDHLSEAANFPMGRQDQSRSPPRQDYQPDFRGRDLQRRDDDMYNGGQSSRFEEALSRRGAHARGGRQSPRGDHDYGGMYDDGGYQGEGDYCYDQQGDERYRNGHSQSREGDDRKISSESGSQHYRDYSHSPTRDAGKPSDTIILEGLPFSVSSSELRDSISETIAADFPSIDVRVSASKGNRRAFVQFQEVDHAVAFMKENFPKLFVKLNQTTDDVPEGRFDAFIHYARGRENRDELGARVANSNDWTCPSCDFSNYATRTKCKVCGGPRAAPNWQQSLTGVTDAANVPSQILVVYPLAPFVAEEIFTKDIKRLEVEKIESPRDQAGAPKLKSTAPSGNTSGYGARPGSLHRTFLMRDASTDESFKYGFVEFWTMEDAAAAVTKFQMSRTFTVAACPVTVSTTHMGVFLPEDREITPAIERMSFHPLFNPSLRVRYRDYHVYPSQTIVTTQPPGRATTNPSTDETNETKKSKKRKADANLPGTSKKFVPMAGTLALWQKKADELRTGSGASKDAQRDSGDALPGFGTGVNAPIKISSSSATKFADPAPREKRKVEPQLATETMPISYVDRDRLMCLICMRKYKSVEEVNIHERSRNHKNSTEKEDLVKAALPRLAIRDKRFQKQAQENPDAASSSLYRDRAKERRQAHNQPTKPSVHLPITKAKSALKSEPPAAAAPLAKSKGAGMLSKMGWTSGVGLGANNDGRTQVVETNAYQEGVGLGAEGGNLGDAAELAERKTKNSYAEYVNTVQDKARERYNRMD